MKTIKKVVLAMFFVSITFSYGQIVGVNSTADGVYDIAILPNESINKELEELKSISHKMYLNVNYTSAKVDDFKGDALIRYNIFKDEMEFFKDEKILFLNKKEGRSILFTNTNLEYKIISFNDKLSYFLVHNKSKKNQLLSRNIIKYKKAKPASTSYEEDKPADLIRQKDQYYISFNQELPILIPSNKKKFYNLFDDKATDVKKFIKTNKIKYKDIKGLKKLVEFLNSI